jgi:hypothetical protein
MLSCAQVLVLLAGYARGRYARLQRDWSTACAGLAECTQAAEVRCCGVSHSVASTTISSSHSLCLGITRAVPGAAAARFPTPLSLDPQSATHRSPPVPSCADASP